MGERPVPNCTTPRSYFARKPLSKRNAVLSTTHVDTKFPPFLLIRRPSLTILVSNASGGFAMAVRSRNFQLGLMLAVAVAGSILPPASQGYTPEQEQARAGEAIVIFCGVGPVGYLITGFMIHSKT